MKNACENFLFVYLDETWIYQKGSQIRRWVSTEHRFKNAIHQNSKVKTILHAGCEFTLYLFPCLPILSYQVRIYKRILIIADLK
jgi:hypothetical protein